MTQDLRIDAVVLAGAPAEELNPEDGTISRAMVDIAGKTMLQRVVDALRGAGTVGRIAAVGHVEADGVDVIVPPGADMMTNIRLGKEALQSETHVLVVTSDIPLLTPEAVDDFVRRAVPLDVDFALPILTKQSCEESYPGMSRTYLTTADGVFTAGNIMLIGPGFIEDHWDTVSEAYKLRKHPFALARKIGMGVLFRALLAKHIPGVLRVSMLEEAIARLLDARVSAVVSNYAEIGEDVDKLSDLEAVRRILAGS